MRWTTADRTHLHTDAKKTAVGCAAITRQMRGFTVWHQPLGSTADTDAAWMVGSSSHIMCTHQPLYPFLLVPSGCPMVAAQRLCCARSTQHGAAVSRVGDKQLPPANHGGHTAGSTAHSLRPPPNNGCRQGQVARGESVALPQ